MCMVEMAIFNIQRAITLKVGKPELWFMCSAHRLTVFNVCVKFHEIKRFKTYEADMKIVNTQRPITPKAGKPKLPFMRSGCHLMVLNICVKFHENIKRF